MRPNIPEFFTTIKDAISRNSREFPTPVNFAQEIRSFANEITELITSLGEYNPGEPQTPMASIKPGWIEDKRELPGNILAIKKRILQIIQNFERNIEILRKEENDPNARNIVGVWDEIDFETSRDPVEKWLVEFPKILTQYADKLEKIAA